MRMNRNEAPQMADRARRRTRLAAVMGWVLFREAGLHCREDARSHHAIFGRGIGHPSSTRGLSATAGRRAAARLSSRSSQGDHMEQRRLGASGFLVPALSLGTGTFGGGNDFFAAWGSTDADGARRLVDICLESGLNMFDSADIYSSGLAESVLGEAIAGRRHQ